jgi:hypothetical protein
MFCEALVLSLCKTWTVSSSARCADARATCRSTSAGQHRSSHLFATVPPSLWWAPEWRRGDVLRAHHGGLPPRATPRKLRRTTELRGGVMRERTMNINMSCRFSCVWYEYNCHLVRSQCDAWRQGDALAMLRNVQAQARRKSARLGRGLIANETLTALSEMLAESSKRKISN